MKYEQKCCIKAEEILSTGKSLAAVCAAMGIARCTLYDWRDTYPEFKEAIDRGLQKAQSVWEDMGESGIKGEYKGFGAAPWIFTMKNRFRDDYKEDKNEKSEASNSLVEKILGKLTE